MEKVLIPNRQCTGGAFGAVIFETWCHEEDRMQEKGRGSRVECAAVDVVKSNVRDDKSNELRKGS
jgi:hypothetical protein